KLGLTAKPFITQPPGSATQNIRDETGCEFRQKPTQPINPMKTNTKSNSGPLSRAFAPLLLAPVVAALCLIPVTGRAQIFVTSVFNNTIGEYNAITGATINSSFISSGLSFPFGIALSGGNLFVANEVSNTIGEYNATTGATINSSYIGTAHI